MSGRRLTGSKLIIGFVALAFCAAPTPGDIGGCGQEPQELDPETFFWSLQQRQCERCLDCELSTRACERACSDSLLQREFPEDCVPLVHDGEVCLRAMKESSCGDYEEYMSDSSPSVPTECDFCPTEGSP